MQSDDVVARLRAIERLAFGYELMHTALCHMAGTSGADGRWYMQNAQEVTDRVSPVWGISETSNPSKPGDCLRHYRSAVPNLSLITTQAAEIASLKEQVERMRAALSEIAVLPYPGAPDIRMRQIASTALGDNGS